MLVVRCGNVIYIWKTMSLDRVLLLNFALFLPVWLSGCATTRQIAVDYPKAETQPLQPPKGYSVIGGDDYYVQLVSEFEFKGDTTLKTGCNEVGAGYESGDLSAALVFNVHNDALKLKRESSGFLYQATTGKCNFRLETKKAVLTPWLRLDSAKDTAIEYSFLTSTSHAANLSQLVNDINAASGLLALTGVGTGIAVMGKLAGEFVDTRTPVVNKPAPSAQYSTETHSMPANVVQTANGVQLNQTRLAVFEVLEGGFKPWAADAKLLGDMRVYPEVATSLLLKSAIDGVPDARDQSFDELLRIPVQSVSGDITLKQLVEQAGQNEQLNLQPDWRNYDDVENQCRRLKLVAKGLGFNKYDRNALLYYFLNQSPHWKNYNLSAQRAMTDAIRPKVLDDYRAKDFSACLSTEDYAVMKSMRLTVNTAQDWDEMTNVRQKKEGVISSVQSAGRQLLSALNNVDADQMARQLYPLLLASGNNGQVLLQNHLRNFGLDALLQMPAIADEGVTITANQLSMVISALKIDGFSCARPAQEQGQPMPNVGILLFATKPDSPLQKGGAIEFELVQGKISRLTIQHPSFRDFEQSILDYPDLGGCRIEADFINRLH